MDAAADRLALDDVPPGTPVFAADGEKLGKVAAAYPTYLLVEQGRFLRTDYLVPRSALAGYDGDAVLLNLPKAAALQEQWDEPATENLPAVAPAPPLTPGETEAISVPVHAETLDVVRRPAQLGTVTIAKEVVTDERTVEVPVTEDRVRIERRVPSPAANPDATAFQKETIAVPIRGEAVDLIKQTRVAEEIELTKESTAATKHLTETVRREEVRIVDSTADDARTE